MNKSLRLVHSVPVEVDEWSRELLHVHSSTLGDPYTVAKPPIGANHEVADFATPQRLTELTVSTHTQHQQCQSPLRNLDSENGRLSMLEARVHAV